MSRRARRIWVPGWLRALLHSPWAERELLRAAAEMEALYLRGLAAEGALASSFGPRERQRASMRAVQPLVGEAAASARALELELGTPTR